MNTARKTGYALTLAALSALATAPDAHAQAGIISYTDIADTFAGTPFQQINQSQSPAINNSGQVLFDALTFDLQEHLYIAQPAGGRTDIANTMAGTPHASFGGGLSLNNTGTAAYASGLRSGSGYGVYTGNGVTQTKIADSVSGTIQSAYTGGPVIAENGAVALFAYGVSGSAGYPALVVAQGGTFTPVAIGNSGQFEYINAHSHNTAGQVAFNTDDYSTGSNNGAFVYRYNPITHVNTKIARAFTGTPVSINELGTVAYEGAPSGGSGEPTGIFTSNGTTLITIASAGQALPGTNIVISQYGADTGININNVGQVAFFGGNGYANQALYLGNGTTTIVIARIGDVYQGHTISQIHFGQDGLNDAGQLVFRADFTDGKAAIIRAAVPAPEPSQFAALAVGVLGLGVLKAKRRAASALLRRKASHPALP